MRERAPSRFDVHGTFERHREPLAGCREKRSRCLETPGCSPDKVCMILVSCILDSRPIIFGSRHSFSPRCFFSIRNTVFERPPLSHRENIILSVCSYYLANTLRRVTWPRFPLVIPLSRLLFASRSSTPPISMRVKKRSGRQCLSPEGDMGIPGCDYRRWRFGMRSCMVHHATSLKNVRLLFRLALRS